MFKIAKNIVLLSLYAYLVYWLFHNLGPVAAACVSAGIVLGSFLG